MSKYSEAIILKGEDICSNCPERIREKCILRLTNDKLCYNRLNPFCTRENPCWNKPQVITVDNKKILLYSCSKCQDYMKLPVKKKRELLKSIGRDDILVGSDIDKILEGKTSKDNYSSEVKKLLDDLSVILNIKLEDISNERNTSNR